ncbi:AzlC family ABC transporter permease [Desertibacillus haloalkaliphilus]|uniref:AzlC family ABC transporter permease n=1 Tax=Desertibacillus haloalkaliphilus TaxID=1328930 RepID=UPI001C252BBE|nr:AzlC family ABC transporter permease [Desertibacillus haloalkaliphilus]MBU8908358.1 AzlC family ABC transporter permease [Desertibacillus haloalkaliphilus]
MATTSVTKPKSEFPRGVVAGIGIAIGYFPAALTFGLLAKSTGLTFLEAVLMSSFVFAGAAQYMALNLIALGTGALEIIFTTFIVNIRHLLMSASVSEKLEHDHPIKKAICAFGITDEVFAVTTTQERKVTTSFVLGVGVIAYGSWVLHSALGFLVGSALPQTIQESMAIALYAMFIALLMPSLKKHRKVVSLAISAAMFNTLFVFFLPSGWSIIAATILSSLLIELVEKKEES